MTRLDPELASPFHVEWLTAVEGVDADEWERAVADRADAILHAARFVRERRATDGTDAEVRVWIEGGNGPACVSITYEPGPAAFGFHLLDETLRERLACVVFDALPCITAEESALEQGLVLDAALRALQGRMPHDDLAELTARIRRTQDAAARDAPAVRLRIDGPRDPEGQA